jgi:mRNA interferase MazF
MSKSIIQYDIWLVNLDPTVGAEIRKTRPCVILNNDDIGVLPLKIVAPVTDYKTKYEKNPWMVSVESGTLNGLSKKSVIDIFQMRSLSENRMIKKIGSLEKVYVPSILSALKSVF